MQYTNRSFSDQPILTVLSWYSTFLMRPHCLITKYLKSHDLRGGGGGGICLMCILTLQQVKQPLFSLVFEKPRA